MKFLRSLPAYKGLKLFLDDYLSSDMPATPPKVYWEYKVPAGEWQELGNDTVGDCEIARLGHIIMLTSAHTGTMLVPTLAEVIAVYSAISGYDPSKVQPDGSNPTDVGCSTPDVLNYWRDTGITIGGVVHKIPAWVQVDPAGIKQAVYLFGGACLDISIYQSMMDQFAAKQAWDNPTGTLLGYHAVPVFGFGSEGCTCVTWAALQQMGWDCFTAIQQGVYAVITPEWINKNGKTYSGFDLAQLQADAKTLAVSMAPGWWKKL